LKRDKRNRIAHVIGSGQFGSRANGLFAIPRARADTQNSRAPHFSREHSDHQRYACCIGPISITRCSKAAARIQTSPTERCTRRDKGAEPFSAPASLLATAGPRILPPRLFVFRPNRSSLFLFRRKASFCAPLSYSGKESKPHPHFSTVWGLTRLPPPELLFALCFLGARAAGHDVRAARYHPRREMPKLDVPICLISARAAKCQHTFLRNGASF
jgi:hypothetical protein